VVLDKPKNTKSVYDNLMSSLSELDQSQISQLENDLAQIASSNGIDLTEVNMDTLRKLIAIYTQTVMEDSAAQ